MTAARDGWRWLASPRQILAHFTRQSFLIRQLTWKETAMRYRGSILGVLWSLLEPLLLFAFYLFVFTVVFELRWGDLEEGRTTYALNLFAGLVVYNVFAETVGSAPSLILSHRSLVKRVIFPLEVLPLSRLLSNLAHSALGFGILLAGIAVVERSLPWTLLLAPLVLLPLTLLTLGITYLVASLGVFVRDMGNVVRIGVLALLFLSPVFYPLSRLPPSWQRLLLLNPLSTIIEDFRLVGLEGEVPRLGPWLLLLVLSVIVGWGGFVWFMRSKRAFADVL